MIPSITNSAAQLGLPIWFLALVILWSLVWKGLALWKSARKNSPVWFVIILVINTMGLLEILYLFVFSKIKLDNKKKIGKKEIRKKKFKKK